MVPQTANRDTPKWFVLKAGRRERAAEAALRERGIECYLPTMKIDRVQGGKKVIIDKPLIGNMIFARGTHARIDSFVKSQEFVHFAYRRAATGFSILEVPDEEMTRFQQTVELMCGDINYYQPETIQISRGTRVKIVGGIFDGHEGTILEDKDKGKPMFLIDFPLLGALGTHVSADFIQILQE